MRWFKALQPISHRVSTPGKRSTFIRHAQTEAEMDMIHTLSRENVTFLNVDRCFQGCGEKLAQGQLLEADAISKHDSQFSGWPCSTKINPSVSTPRCCAFTRRRLRISSARYGCLVNIHK